MNNIRLLVYIIHYFDHYSKFNGKSKFQNPNIRLENLNKCINALSNLNYNVEIKLCGFGDKNLTPIDIDFSTKITDPQLILYEVLSSLHLNLDFDFVIVIEDDILVNPVSIQESINFTLTNNIKFVYHPHRMELNSRNELCPIDIFLLPGKTGKYIEFEKRKLAEYMNPHAAFLMLSKEQVIYASKKVNLKTRDKIYGGYMASAFYNYFKSFELYRDQLPVQLNYNIHLDPILFQPTWRNKIKRIFVYLLEKYFIEYGKIFGLYKG